MLSALVLCNDVIGERTRQNIDFVCSSVAFQILIWLDSKLRKVLKNVLEVHCTEHEMSDNFRLYYTFTMTTKSTKS